MGRVHPMRVLQELLPLMSPDISMCTGDKCPTRETCYRYTAKPSPRQSYFVDPPIGADGECEYFMEVW